MSVTRIEVPASPEVLAAWQEHLGAERASAEGLTIQELANIAGCGITAMRGRLRNGVANGVYLEGKRYTRDAMGRGIAVSVWRLAEKPAKGRKK